MGRTALVKKNGNAELETLAGVTNDAEFDINNSQPYTAEVRIRGTAPMLFHRWSCDAVKSKSEAGKNSKAKKEDNIESYVYRNDKGEICLPGEYLRMSIIGAAKFRQDPRSPRKSAMDLFKAGLLCQDELCPIQIKNKNTKAWEYLDQRRVVIQRSGITRVRPAFNIGWEVFARIGIVLPEWIDRKALLETLEMSGKVIGIADFRPTFGRFQVVSFDIRPFV